MDRILWISALLVTAGLAGCTGGGDEAGQLPAGLPDGQGDTASQGQDRSPGPRGQGQGQDGASGGWRGDLFLEVEPKHGGAPLDVTIRYDVGEGSRGGQGNGTGNGGNGTGQGNQGQGNPGNATGNQTGNGGNGTGQGNQGQGDSGNATGNETGNGGGAGGNQTAGGQDVSGTGSNLTWTLTMWRMQPGDEAEAEDGMDGNATGNGTATSSSSASATGTAGPSGNGTGNQTGNATGNSTGNGTTTGPSGNATGNATGNSTGGSGNGTADGFQGEGNLTLMVNGTLADLPGVTTQRVESAGHYMVRFTVDHGNGTTTKRTATVHVRAMQDGDPLGNETRTFEGSFLASDPLLCSGSEEFEWPLNATFGGFPATVGRLNVTLESDGLLDDYELALVAPNGTEVASGPSLDVPGPLGNGTYTLLVESCVAADTSFVVTAIADYVYARVPPPPAPTEAEDEDDG